MSKQNFASINKKIENLNLYCNTINIPIPPSFKNIFLRAHTHIHTHNAHTSKQLTCLVEIIVNHSRVVLKK